MNGALGNVGATVVYTQTVEAQPMNQRAGLQKLVDDMNAGTVELLLILGGNPVYTAPVDLNFAERDGEGCGPRASRTAIEDETAALCHWHISETHFLEMWSDVAADDGTVTIIQPLIAPLYGGKSAHEVMSALSAGAERPGYDLVRAYWNDPAHSSGSGRDAPRQLLPPAGAPGATPRLAAPLADTRGCGGAAATAAFDRDWRKWLHDGVVPNTAFAPKTVAVQANFAVAGRASPAPARASKSSSVPIRPSTTGALRTTPGCRKLPKSLTKLTWDNAALICSRHGGSSSPDQRRRRRIEAGRPHPSHSGMAGARPGAGHADRCISDTAAPAPAVPARAAAST